MKNGGEGDPNEPWNDKRTVSGVRTAVATSSGRVLLLDHYSDWLNFVAFILRRRGHDVFTARTGPDASSILANEAVDVLVCGITDESGLAVIRRAKAIGAIRTVFLSRDGTEILGLPRGTIDMPLLRPVPILSLVETIESFLPSTDQRLG